MTSCLRLADRQALGRRERVVSVCTSLFAILPLRSLSLVSVKPREVTSNLQNCSLRGKTGEMDTFQDFNLSMLLEGGEKISLKGLTDLPWFLEGMYGLGNESMEGDCCDDGDVCNLNEAMSFDSVAIPLLYSLAFFVGILGNCVLLAVLVQSWRRWSVTDTFILHLCVADILLLVTLPFWAAEAALSEGWIFGASLCKITGAIFTINFYCGIFLLACISLDRYLSIVHAAAMFSRRTPRVVQASCCAVWLVSILLSIPDWIFLDAIHDDRREKTECVRDYFKFDPESVGNWRMASRLLYHILGFIIPSLILIFCYSCILYRLRCATHSLQKQKAFRVTVSLVVVFFLCWTPYNITLLVDTVQTGNATNSCGARNAVDKAMVVTASLGYLHSSLNPVLYAFVGVKFRRQLLGIFSSLGCKRKSAAKLKSSFISRGSSLWPNSTDNSNSIVI